MSSHEIQAPHASLPARPAATRPVVSDDPERRSPPAPRPGIRTGVHWRPGPASAWSFLAEDPSAPVEPGP
jgi:hypothetical protein